MSLSIGYAQTAITSGMAAVASVVYEELGYILAGNDYVYLKNPFQPGDHHQETTSIGPEAGPRPSQAVQRPLDNLGGHDRRGI